LVGDGDGDVDDDDDDDCSFCHSFICFYSSFVVMDRMREIKIISLSLSLSLSPLFVGKEEGHNAIIIKM
jgi:hypothetical protein